MAPGNGGPKPLELDLCWNYHELSHVLHVNLFFKRIGVFYGTQAGHLKSDGGPHAVRGPDSTYFNKGAVKRART